MKLPLKAIGMIQNLLPTMEQKIRILVRKKEFLINSNINLTREFLYFDIWNEVSIEKRESVLLFKISYWEIKRYGK